MTTGGGCGTFLKKIDQYLLKSISKNYYMIFFLKFLKSGRPLKIVRIFSETPSDPSPCCPSSEIFPGYGPVVNRYISKKKSPNLVIFTVSPFSFCFDENLLLGKYPKISRTLPADCGPFRMDTNTCGAQLVSFIFFIYLPTWQPACLHAASLINIR